MCFAPQRRALFRHLNCQEWSAPLVFCTFWPPNVLRATTACSFLTSQLPKVVRHWGVLHILISKCASRHNGVHFFDISTAKSGPHLVCFVHFDLEMCFAPQRRALFHLSSGQLAPRAISRANLRSGDCVTVSPETSQPKVCWRGKLLHHDGSILLLGSCDRTVSEWVSEWVREGGREWVRVSESVWEWVRVSVWECESVRVWECESVRVWECESVRVWECESVRVWEWESERVREWESERVREWVRYCFSLWTRLSSQLVSQTLSKREPFQVKIRNPSTSHLTTPQIQNFGTLELPFWQPYSYRLQTADCPLTGFTETANRQNGMQWCKSHFWTFPCHALQPIAAQQSTTVAGGRATGTKIAQ